MQCTADGDAIHVRSPAKVNLVLEVCGKRADGFHELAMANVTVSLYDEVTVRREPEPCVTCTVNDPAIPTDDRNLAVRAAQQLIGDRGLGVHIDLVKRIPAGAGLAGGSGDAAATLVAVDRLYGLGTTPEALAEIAAAIGSDIPYMLHGGGACCYGRGEIIEPQPCPNGLAMVIAWPGVELSTKSVYEAVSVPLTPLRERASVLFARIGALEGWSGVGELLFNRLEAPARQLCPEIGDIAIAMQSLATQGVVMTGSGSAVVGLCRSLEHAEQVAMGVRDRVPCRTFAVTTVAE